MYKNLCQDFISNHGTVFVLLSYCNKREFDITMFKGRVFIIQRETTMLYLPSSSGYKLSLHFIKHVVIYSARYHSESKIFKN